MPAAMQPNKNRRILYDNIFGLGNGRRLLQLGEEFFYETGRFLRDREIAEKLPPPHRSAAIAWIHKLEEQDIKIAAAGVIVDATLPPEVARVGEASGVIEVKAGG